MMTKRMMEMIRMIILKSIYHLPIIYVSSIQNLSIIYPLSIYHLPSSIYIDEIYIDDVLIHSETDPEFLTNTRRVFERLRTQKVAVNPRKIKLGLKKVEYAGVIRFSAKLSSALNWTGLPGEKSAAGSTLVLAPVVVDDGDATWTIHGINVSVIAVTCDVQQGVGG